MEWSADDLARLGQETLTLKHEFKRQCGFDLEGVRIPRRILETPTPMGQVDEGFIRQALQVYREAVLPDGRRLHNSAPVRQGKAGVAS